jgi:hypothetical protein
MQSRPPQDGVGNVIRRPSFLFRMNDRRTACLNERIYDIEV